MWQPTGLTAVAGKPVSFLVAAGQAWTNGPASWSADGNAADLAPGNNVPLTGAPRMALIGRIGTAGAPFLVGSGYQAPAAQSGQIYLVPNDDWYALHDNAGSLSVTVCPGETPCTLDGTVTAAATAAPGESIAFIAAVTSTGCLNAVSYAWDFGDGTPASAEAAPSHAYTAHGTYSWSITVTSGSQQLVRRGTVLVMEPGSCVPATKTVAAKPAGGGLAGMWQATGITVGAGETMTLSAGAGQTWTNGGATWTAAGNASDVMQGANCPMPGAPRMALIGRVGATGAPFLVGQQKQMTAPTAGEIYLAPNDDWYMLWDNAGTLTVSVCAGGATCSVDATATVPPTGSASSPVAFAATATATNCAGSLTFEWNFGDGGPASTEANPSHAYAAGTYTWTLTVRAGSATATRTGSITVTAPGACVPATKTVLAKPAGSGLAAMWQATGVTVQAGETLTIGATGQSWTNGGRTWTAAGDAADLVYGQNGPLSGAPRMALIGRIGATGTPFLIGTLKEVTAATGGELFLAPNDDWYLLWDNAGTLSVSVCAGPATCRVEALATAPATATAGTPVPFAGTGSATACAGAPVFEWDFGDGSPASREASPSHTFAAAGTYAWTLTVTADTETVTRSGSIQVREPGACTTEMRTVLAKPTGSGLAGMWQATGITLALGDIIEFDAAGGQTWVNGGRAFTADGNSGEILQGQNCPLPGSGRMALVGRIGEQGTPFIVGQRRQITATSAGQLYLAPNDDWYLLWDNAGSLAVSICR
jgi:PKD repeat protein